MPTMTTTRSSRTETRLTRRAPPAEPAANSPKLANSPREFNVRSPPLAGKTGSACGAVGEFPEVGEFPSGIQHKKSPHSWLACGAGGEFPEVSEFPSGIQHKKSPPGWQNGLSLRSRRRIPLGNST